MTIRMNNGYGTTYSFRVTDRIPSGYEIWNIGDNMVPGYLPITMLKPGTYEIRPETLMAIPLPVEELKILRKAAGSGCNSLESAKRILNRGSRYISDELAGKVYEILSRISEN